MGITGFKQTHRENILGGVPCGGASPLRLPLGKVRSQVTRKGTAKRREPNEGEQIPVKDFLSFLSCVWVPVYFSMTKS